MKESVFQRDVFIKEIFSAAKNDRDIFFISADFGAPALDIFREELPQQFLHSGISEQHMIDMAAGLALAGKKVYVYAMAPFITLRCIEQIKCSLALMSLPVTLLSVGVGLGYADAGPTHYSTEDIACMRSITGLDVWSPCDESSTRAIAKDTLQNPSLRVVRMERDPVRAVYGDDFFIDDSGYKELKVGNEVCVVSYGHLLHRVLQSTADFETRKISVVDVYRIKPQSSKLADLFRRYKGVLTVEEQCLNGGFGSAILELMAEHGVQVPVIRMGLPDRYYFDNGGREFLLDYYGLSIADIRNGIERLVDG